MKPMTGTILREGTFTMSDGEKMTFTNEMLTAITKAYNPEIYRAPLVVGHPSGEEKYEPYAMGSVNSLQLNDEGEVVAEIDPTESLTHSLASGTLLAHSSGLYGPDSPNNPAPGTWSLHHLAFLGATPPAIKGLKPFAFAENNQAEIVVFNDHPKNFIQSKEKTMDNLESVLAEKAELEQEVKSLQAKVAATAAAETKRSAVSFSEKLVSAGQLPTEAKDKAVSLICAAEATNHNKENLAVMLRELLEQLPKQQLPEVNAVFSEPPAKSAKSAPTADQVAKLAAEQNISSTAAYDQLANTQENN